VFDDKEAEDRVTHGQLHVLEARSCDGAQERVQNQADQHLQAQAVREKREPDSVAGQPHAACHRTTCCGANGGDAGQDDEPSEP
jgi:hypothetical protein